MRWPSGSLVSTRTRHAETSSASSWGETIRDTRWETDHKIKMDLQSLETSPGPTYCVRRPTRISKRKSRLGTQTTCMPICQWYPSDSLSPNLLIHKTRLEVRITVQACQLVLLWFLKSIRPSHPIKFLSPRSQMSTNTFCVSDGRRWTDLWDTLLIFWGSGPLGAKTSRQSGGWERVN